MGLDPDDKKQIAWYKNELVKDRERLFRANNWMKEAKKRNPPPFISANEWVDLQDATVVAEQKSAEITQAHNALLECLRTSDLKCARLDTIEPLKSAQDAISWNGILDMALSQYEAAKTEVYRLVADRIVSRDRPVDT